jgi:hypothetical protein
MLKLTYSEFGLHLEQIGESLEQLVVQRSILAVRIGESLCIQPGNASFLVSTAAMTANLDLDRITNLHHPISFCCVDEDFYEVNIAGVWITKNSQAAEGLFAARLGDRAESVVQHLWQSSQQEVPTYN